MEIVRPKKRLEREHFTFELLQRCLPIDEGHEDEEIDVGRWPQIIVAIVLFLNLVRFCFLGYSN
jgi:hypothetical protein